MRATVPVAATWALANSAAQQLAEFGIRSVLARW